MCGDTCVGSGRVKPATASQGMEIVLPLLVTWLCVLLGVLSQLSGVLSFNMDPRTAVVHTGDRGSMFGFDVAQHLDQGQSWLLIGAPKAQTTQKGIEQGGAVYRCKTERVNDCQQIPFDSKGNNIRWNGSDFLDIEDKSHQWFGATVQSSGENGVIVACAPRHVYYSHSLDKREPIGKCLVSKTSTRTFTEYSPCKTAVEYYDRYYGIGDQYHKQGYCQAGYSVILSHDGTRLLIGAVGSWYWQGQLYHYRLDEGRKKFNSTGEGPASDDDSYMGYSSAVGEFDGDGKDDYVVGVPRGDKLQGKVSLLSQNLTVITNISGDEMGSYFGYSVTVSDLNGDGRDDIIVGAPLASTFSSHSYERGRVYIFYQSDQRGYRFSERVSIDGPQSKARFGLALTGMGDMNLDGFQDLAVGCPYAGEDGRGAVYIYLGSGKGINTESAQVIHAKDIGDELTTFGFSLSGGHDLDHNHYADLLVGSYVSDKAVFLKSRPIVRVAASLRINPQNINLEEEECTLVDGTRVTCLTIETCLEYNGIGVPEELYFDVSWHLDTIKNLSRRSFYLPDDRSFSHFNTVKLKRKTKWCPTSYGYVKKDVRDKLTPIAVDFDFKLHRVKRHKRRTLTPILDQYIPTKVRTQAQILKHCGFDNLCIPDLVLRTTTMSESHLLGSKNSTISLQMIVDNRGEDAFEAQLFLSLPPGVLYRGVDNPQNAAVPVTCGAVVDTSLVHCDIGNPLPGDITHPISWDSHTKNNKRLMFTIKVSPSYVNGSSSVLRFEAQVNSSNTEKFTDTINNRATITLPVEVKAELLINGASSPEQIVYNSTRKLTQINWQKEEGPAVIHLYELRNGGPSTTQKTRLEVLWPSYDVDGEPLLSLTHVPRLIPANGACHTIDINPRNHTNKGAKGIDMEVILQQLHEKGGNNPGQPEISYTETDRDKRASNHRGYVERTCTEEWCTVISCLLGRMESDDSTLLEITSRLSTKTLLKNNYHQQLKILSLASAQVLELPYSMDIDTGQLEFKAYNVSTDVNPANLIHDGRGVEIWIIAVAISAGLLILLLIALLLYMCGFFKRKRPNDSISESEPLNKTQNGDTKRLDIEDKTFE